MSFLTSVQKFRFLILKQLLILGTDFSVLGLYCYTTVVITVVSGVKSKFGCTSKQGHVNDSLPQFFGGSSAGG